MVQHNSKQNLEGVWRVIPKCIHVHAQLIIIREKFPSEIGIRFIELQNLKPTVVTWNSGKSPWNRAATGPGVNTGSLYTAFV